MPNGNTVASAYVQIVPSAEGIKGSITQALGGEASSAGESLGSTLVGKIKGVIAAAGIGAALGKTLTEGAALQQSIGGVETLFKDSANTIKQYASQAYKTAGVSANSYMEQVTSFSATLLQGLGGDTAAAAKYANQAIVQMSDNANKMGTDISSIQWAYQGFAKDNFTMLDNLKLGYGGTQAEMARLINDSGVLGDAVEVTAQTVKDVPFDKIIEAIQVIQDKLGITGTTAKEAATTFSGSFASMQAAVSNVMGALMLGQDLQPALQGLADSVTTFLIGNLLPAIWNILSGLPGALATFAQDLGPQLIGGLINSINQQLPGLGSAMAGVTATIAGAFVALKALVAGQAIVSGILGIVSALKVFAAAASFASSPLALLQGILIAFVNPVTVVVAIIGALAGAFIYFWNTSEPFKQFWIDVGTNIANFVSGAAQQIVNFFTVTLPAGIQSAIAFVQQLPEKIASFFSQIPYNVGYFLGLALGTLSSWAVQLPGIAAQAASTFLSNAISFFSQLPGQLQNWLTSALNNVSNWAVQLGQKGIQAAKTLVSNVVNGVQELPGKLLSVGKMAVEGLWNGIVGAGRWLKDQIGSFVNGIVDGFKAGFDINSPSKIMADKIGRFLPPGIAEGMLNALPVLNSAISKVSATIQTGLLKSSTAAQRLMSFETMPIQNLRTTLATAAANPPQLNPVPSAPAGSGISYDQLLQLFNMLIAVIRENGGEIVIGDDVIGRANARYMQDRAIVTGGVVF